MKVHYYESAEDYAAGRTSQHWESEWHWGTHKGWDGTSVEFPADIEIPLGWWERPDPVGTKYYKLHKRTNTGVHLILDHVKVDAE